MPSEIYNDFSTDLNIRVWEIYPTEDGTSHYDSDAQRILERADVRLIHSRETSNNPGYNDQETFTIQGSKQAKVFVAWNSKKETVVPERMRSLINWLEAELGKSDLTIIIRREEPSLSP